MKLLIGTYTKKDSEGIYEAVLEGNKISEVRLVAKANNPTYLDYDKDSDTLFSVVSEEGKGGVGVFKKDKDMYVLETTITEDGTPPCYVRYNVQEAELYDANYHRGLVHVYKNDAVEKVIQYGEGSKAHYIDIDPKTGDVFTCDLGKDTVHKYRLMNEIATYKTAPGMGPRHIAFHPTLPILYVFGELNNTIDVLADDEFDLVHKQTITTLNPETKSSSGAAIKISQDGRFVYASNRGEDSLVVFEVQEEGTLEEIQRISTFGEHPRDFALSTDDQYVVVANMNTENLTLYSRDQETGVLEVIQKEIAVPEPVCIKFI